MNLWHDIRYALRRLRFDWKFSLTVTAILALCIGANAALFSIFDSVLLSPLPYPEPDRLLKVVTRYQLEDGDGLSESQDGIVWEAVRDQTPSMDATVFSNWTSGVNLVRDGRGRYVRQQRVSAGFFRVFGVTPMLGREFTQEEDQPGGAPAVILSHRLWENDFGSDPAIIGRTVFLRGEPYPVAGVMPAAFESAVGADLWTPIQPSVRGEGGGTNYAIVARLKPGVSAARADAEVAALTPGVLERGALWRDPPPTLGLMPLQRASTNHLDDPLLLLTAASVSLLLLGCINISGMLLARSARRSDEIATRFALGAAQSRIFSQLLVESSLLALFGGAGALALSWGLVRSLQVVAGSIYPELLGVTIQWPVLAATFGLAALCGLLFGLIPAVQASRSSLQVTTGSRSAAGRRRLLPLGLLAGGQVALMIPLLLGAGLLIRTFQHLWDLDPGFDPTHVSAARFSLQDARYRTPEQVQALFERGLRELRSQPGIEAAAISLSLPYERGLNMPFTLPGQEGFDRAVTNVAYVSAGFFDVLQIPLLRGRLFDQRDDTEGATAIVNDAFVRRYLDGGAAVGETVGLGSTEYSIVGLVGSVQQRPGWGDFGPLAPIPSVYVTVPSLGDDFLPTVHTWFSPSWLVRSALPQRELTASLERAAAAADPMLPLASVTSLAETKAGSLSQQRLMAVLLAALGSLALLLAALGIYGLTSNIVAERWRELGIRQALGSTRGGTVSAVLSRTLGWVVAGAVAGSFICLAMEQLLASFIFGVSATDPMTLALVAAGFVLATALASLFPALTVVRLDPATVLRAE